MDKLGIIFALVRKSQRNGKKTSACRKNILRNYALCWNFTPLHEKCPNAEFFLVRIFLYSVRIQKNTDQKKLCIWIIFTQCTFRKTKDFEIQFSRRCKWVQQYITLHMKVGRVKWQILLVSGNWQFWKLSGLIRF